MPSKAALAARAGSTEHEGEPRRGGTEVFRSTTSFFVISSLGCRPAGARHHLRLTRPSPLTASPLRLQGGLTYVSPPGLGRRCPSVPDPPKEVPERNRERER